MQILNNQFQAVIGDLDHKKDVYLFFGRADNAVVLKFLTNAAQAQWVRENRADLIPTHPPGIPPSDHRIASVFEENYVLPLFRFQYLFWLKTQDV